MVPAVNSNNQGLMATLDCEITEGSGRTLVATEPLIGVDTQQSEKGAMFKLLIPPGGELAYRIAYGQKPVSGEATYIITTTQYWKKPFEFAKYSFSYPDDLSLDFISIPPDSTSISNEKTHQYWEMENFMPEVDFIFKFTEK